MCGFFVAFNPNNEQCIGTKALTKTLNSIKHRGFDGYGMEIMPHISMGHCRLKIVGGDDGAQPFKSVDKNTILVYNGEIYNYQELKNTLISYGYVFYTKTDTEVISVGYQHWGEALFQKLDGMFALVIWDIKKQQLVTARDRYGIKPLYKRKLNNGIWLFSSEMSPLLSFDQRPTLNIAALDNYMTLGYVIEPKTLYTNVFSEQNAHYTCYQRNQASSTHCYWQLHEKVNEKNQYANKEETKQLIKKAVFSQIPSSIDYALFLSGGLDSSILLSLTNRVNNRPNKAYSYQFSDGHYDESQRAKYIAHHFNVAHQTVKEAPILDVLKNIRLDVPLADNAYIPTTLLSNATKSNEKVLLTGDGADELFFGYRNHKLLLMEEQMKAVIPTMFKGAFLKTLAGFYPNSPKMPRFLRAKSTLNALTKSTVLSYFNASSVNDRLLLESLYSDVHKKALIGMETEHEFVAIASDVAFDNPLKLVQYMDFKTYLPSNILVKTDRATMTKTKESRVPFLSNALVDYQLSAPVKYNLSLWQNKKMLRKSVKSWLPSVVTNQPKKSFTSPVDVWFRQTDSKIVFQTLFSSALMDSGWFSIEKITTLLEEHRQNKINAGGILYTLFVLSHYLSQY